MSDTEYTHFEVRASYNEDVFIHCSDCSDIVTLDPDTVADIVAACKKHRCQNQIAQHNAHS